MFGGGVIGMSECVVCFFFFSSRRRHTRYWRDWSSDVCSSDLGLAQGGEFVGVGFPIELARVDDDATQGRPVAADELGGAVYHDVGTMLNGANKIRSAEGIVDDERQLMAVGNVRPFVNVGHVGVRIAEGFGVEGPCLGTYGDRKSTRLNS